MHNLTITKDGDSYWIQAKSEGSSDLFHMSEENVKKLSLSLDKALKEGVGSTESSFKITCDKPNCFTVLFGFLEDTHYHGYCLSKSKLTVFRNQLMGVLNG